MERTKQSVQEIRQAEAQSHTKAYSDHVLFTPGSWLQKPVQTVMDLVPLLMDRENFRGLDLGCGVGRNSIPLAQRLGRNVCVIDCVDLLPIAINKLREYAEQNGVADRILGICTAIDDFVIPEKSYDLVLAVSALEHVASETVLHTKLKEIQQGLQKDGVVCLIMNTNVKETDKETGKSLMPQFEVNLQTTALQELLHRIFSEYEILKELTVKQRYDIPRSERTVRLETNVVTFVARKATGES